MTEEKHISELTDENSFWKLYKLTRKIPTSKDNLYVYWLFFSLFILIAPLSTATLDLKLESFAVNVKDLIGWSISILGFILAGYSIFASLTDKSLQLKLASAIEPKTKLNLLKHTHCLFVKVLIELIIMVFLAYILKVIFSKEVILPLIDIMGIQDSIASMAISFIDAVISSLFVMMLLLCKSFIYNVYHVIMVSIRWHAQK